MFHSKQDVDRHVNEVFRNIKSESQRNLKGYQIAKLYYKFRDYKSAIKFINRYNLTTYNSAAAYRLLGECYLGINLKAKALEAFKTSLVHNGSQNDLVLKICTLLMDPDVSAVTPKATYWLERAETLFPSNPVVFQLREHLLKANLDGKQDNGQLEKLILSEISARPADVTVRIRLLNFFVDTKRYKIAYQHALEIEDRNTFSNDFRWYDCLCNVLQTYEKTNNELGFTFFIKKIIFFEKRADLSMQEFQEEVKTLSECSSAVFAFDQNLHAVSKIEVPQEETYFFTEFLKHMRAQLSFHLATLVLKRAKKEYGIWPKAFRTASPLLLQATQNTMDLEEAWYNMWPGKNKMEKEIKQLNKSATLRISQAGHVLLAWSQSKGSKFLEKIFQFCGGKWQNHVYQDIFYNREHQQASATSHFINDAFFANVPMRLLSEAELSHFDEVSQSAYPDSLHHLVWLGLAYCNANGTLSHDFRCTTVPDLQFTVANLNQTGPETLNQLDVDAFLYASVLCAKSATPNIVSSDRPNRLPVSISEELCSPAQADWWVAVYRSYTNQGIGNIADMRIRLRKGIEVIRLFGQHGLHVKIIVMLAKLFQERATKNKNPNESNGLEERAYLYWTAAIPLLEKIEKNQQLREVPNRLFDYRGKDLTSNEVKGHLEEGRLFLGCRLMKQGKHEQAIEAFQTLKSPYATFYQALIYEKLASEEVNHRPESITSENRSQHIILLTRARDAFYLTLDRLRCPSVDPNHPLNAQLHDHLDQIERQLAMIDPDSNLNRNADSQSDETDTAPGLLSPDVDENLESSFNVYNTSNFLNAKNHSTSRNIRQNLPDRHQSTRFEARPSPERLDAQLRHLVQANSNGLQAIVEQLKEMKSTMQIELKDLGCVTRDLLAEMKRWNDRLEASSKRAADVLKSEDLFEEDYEDLSQISQPYAPYHNYQINRQMTGTQGTSNLYYGTSVPSPVPPVQPVIPTPENPLIPPAFYPGVQPVSHIDPSLLLHQSLGYYAPGMPYNENQTISDYRGSGIQKGAPFGKNAFKVPENVPTTTVVTTKAQPPNVVITSSDTLPAFTCAGTPIMSVTVPPQHIRGLSLYSVAQKPNTGQVHPFQIPMTSQAQLVKENPKDKLDSLVSTTSSFSTPLVSDVKPTPVQQTGLLKEISPIKSVTPTNVISEVKASFEPKFEKNHLFKSRGKLSVLDKQWQEKGNVEVKVINEDKAKKVRILIVGEGGFTVFADHFITPKMSIQPLAGNSHGWSWTASKPGKIDSNPVEVTYRVEFNTLDEAKDFEFAFNEGRKIAKETNPVEVHKKTPPKEVKSKECKTCKARVEGDADKCSSCISKEKSNEKTKLGGFTFTSPVVAKPPVLNLSEKKEKPKEAPKPSPFAEFSFSSASTPAKTDAQPKTTGPFFSDKTQNTGQVNLFAGVKNDPNSFKKDTNFKDFEGKGSLVFGYLNDKGTPNSKSNKNNTSTNSNKNESVEEGEDDFVPTDEFKPVIDLPDLVDVKTGEENDKVLFDERAKLLRFDTNLKEWKERGVGQMRVLLSEENGKVRLIMRRELVLKVCCNHYLDEKIEFKRMEKSPKALTWYAQDYSEGQLIPELFALKFANVDSMVRFETAVKDIQKKMENGRVKDIKPKESTEEKPKELKPLSEMFKPAEGSWECGACFLRNDKTAMKCVSCETPKPGTETKVSESSSQSSGLGKGITFPPATTKFTFGIPQTTTTTTSAPSTTSATTFTFGLPKTTTTTSSFSFGGFQWKTDTATPATFTFGTPSANTKTSETSSPLFSIGTSGSSTGSNSSAKPSFSSIFPKSSTSATLFTMGQTGTPPSTNAAVTTAVSSFNLFSPGTNTIATKNFTSFSPATPKTEDKAKTETQSTPVFSVSGLKPTEKEKFTFSLNPSKTTPPKTKSSSPKRKASGDGGSSDESGGEDEAEEDDNEDNVVVKPIVPLPEKVDLHTGEEDEDVLYSQRSKLFRFIDKEWKERGIGDVKILKHKTTNKLRLLMRRETILKVCLNHYLTSDIVFQPKTEKSWTWVAVDFSEGEAKHEMFAIRFRDDKIAQEFKKAIDDALSNKLAPVAPAKEEKVGEPTAAMKNFTFAVPKPSESSQSNKSEDDILVVYENKVTPEQREKAMSLGLPPNFYAYLQAPDCPGCPGCDKDEEPAAAQVVQPPKFTPVSNPIFGNKPWGSLNFGNSSEKFSFSFGAPQKTTNAVSSENEEEDEDDDEENKEDVEDEEEDEEKDEDDEEAEEEEEEDEDEDEDVDEDEDEDDEDYDEERHEEDWSERKLKSGGKKLF